MTISITLHDLTVDQLRDITNVLGGETPVEVVPASPNLTLNGEPATEKEVEAAIEATIGDDAPPPATISEDVDKNGLPWDERIHAATKTKTKDGSWKKKRGVDDTLVTEVEAELKGNETTPTPPPPSLFEQEVPPAPAVNPQVDFNDVMALATGAITNGDIDQDELVEIVSKHGGGDAGLQSLFTAPDALNGVYAELKGLLND